MNKVKNILIWMIKHGVHLIHWFNSRVVRRIFIYLLYIGLLYKLQEREAFFGKCWMMNWWKACTTFSKGSSPPSHKRKFQLTKRQTQNWNLKEIIARKGERINEVGFFLIVSACIGNIKPIPLISKKDFLF
jgi:hypothetical protein